NREAHSRSVLSRTVVSGGSLQPQLKQRVGRAHCKEECGTFTRLRFHPNMPAIPIDGLLAYGQSDSRAFVFISVKTLEDPKNLRQILCLNLDALSRTANRQRPS